MNHRVAVIALDEKSSRPITVMSVVLADPRTGTGQGYMLLNGRLLECQHFKQMFSAWLVGSQLLPDGSLHTCTPMDPLFVLLPVLDAARKQSNDSPGVFSALDQIIEEGAVQWPALPLLLQQGVVGPSDLECVCDVKRSGGEDYYRLNDNRVLAWLVCKAGQAQHALSAQLAGMSPLDQHTYCCDFLAEYLAPKWAVMLRKHFNVPEDNPSQGGRPADSSHGEQSATKRLKLDPKEAAREMARKRAQQARLEDAAKQASGTKKLTAFFTPKAKVKE
ncbi:ribonuclease H2, subunit B [Haematococcus lacustris]